VCAFSGRCHSIVARFAFVEVRRLVRFVSRGNHEKRGREAGQALQSAQERNGDSLFFFSSFYRPTREEQRFLSLSGRIIEPKSPVRPSACVRFKCPARCEEREDPSPLSHDPTLATYQVRMPASSVAQLPRSRQPLPTDAAPLGHVTRTGFPHQRGASVSRGT